MCGMPACTTVPRTRRIETEVPGARAVVITFCPDCDTRTCGTVVGSTADGQPIKCSNRISNPHARKCTAGHIL